MRTRVLAPTVLVTAFTTSALIAAIPHSTKSTRSEPLDVPIVAANDNRISAGALRNDTLYLNLLAQVGRWYPEAADGPFVDVAVLAESGRPPQIPAPLIRVPTGTTIVANIRNTLADSVVWIRGLMSRPGTPDSVPVNPGESRTLTFSAGAPGTYLYGASPGRLSVAATAGGRTAEEDQLTGAFIVDPVGPPPRDRILIINLWGRRQSAEKYRQALTINGKSWPHTERFDAIVGDSVHWRVINGTSRRHPIHLHGFYFRVDSRGSIFSDTLYSPESRRLAVTEDMAPWTSMSMIWSPDRPGNWLLHCHLTFHVTGGARLDGEDDEHAIHATDPMKHMAGLVVGINVKTRPGQAPAATENWKASNVRRLRLFATERRRTGPTPVAMSYVLQRDARPPAPDSVEPPGQPIVLTRGQPTEIKIINRAHDGTAVHWHGIELESYSDGVPGWSGFGKLAPLVAPNDSFTARLSLPRAGTFIYHTHLNDVEQLTAGMYGPIVVLEPGEKFDPTRDHIFTLGWDGPKTPPTLVINGDSVALPLVLDSASVHRFRFINIGAAQAFPITIRLDTAVIAWRPRAKDGADLPAASRKSGPARTFLNVGETFDAELENLARGEYVMSIGPRTRRIIVR
jgi:FtsP/CotA-like multicopper oxidase with cupredoxin domain